MWAHYQTIIHKVSCYCLSKLALFFIVYTIVFTTSLQNTLDSLFFAIISLAASVTDLFLLSTIPFCSRVLGAESYLLIPLASKNIFNSFDIKSPPLSNSKHLILILDSFSTLFL